MAVLCDFELRKMIEDGELGLTDFSEDCVQPASYDLRVGKFAYVSSNKAPTAMTEGGSIVLDPGNFMLITTFERLKLPSNVRGKVGLRSRHSLAGLVNLSGPQIDPGFSGHLTLGIVNMGPRRRVIQFKERFFTVEFDRLEQTPVKQYGGMFHGTEHIAPQLIDAVTDNESRSIPEMARRLARVERATNLHRWGLTVIGVPIALAVITQIVQQYFN